MCQFFIAAVLKTGRGPSRPFSSQCIFIRLQGRDSGTWIQPAPHSWTKILVIRIGVEYWVWNSNPHGLKLIENGRSRQWWWIWMYSSDVHFTSNNKGGVRLTAGVATSDHNSAIGISDCCQGAATSKSGGWTWQNVWQWVNLLPPKPIWVYQWGAYAFKQKKRKYGFDNFSSAVRISVGLRVNIWDS